jgi:bacterioferritin (cytochrome b1)
MKINISMSSGKILTFPKKKKKESIVPKSFADQYMEAVYTFEPDPKLRKRWLDIAERSVREYTVALNGKYAVDHERDTMMALIAVSRVHCQILKADTEEEWNTLHDLLEPLQKKVREEYAKIKK